MAQFCGNTKDDIYNEMSQWQVEGQGSTYDDDTISPDGCFYEEAASEIKTALLKGGFSSIITTETPIAYDYIAAIHRKMTALLYIQSRRLNIAVDGQDVTRGQWHSLRQKLKAISHGEPFGEIASPAKNIGAGDFYSLDGSPFYDFVPINRSL